LLPWTFQRINAFARENREGPVLFHAGWIQKEPAPTIPNLAFNADLYLREMELLARAYAGRLTILLIVNYNPDSPYGPSREEACILRAAAELDLSIVDTRAAHGEFARHRTSPFGFSNNRFNSGHMNPQGHAAAGRLLSREILRLHNHELL